MAEERQGIQASLALSILSHVLHQTRPGESAPAATSAAPPPSSQPTSSSVMNIHAAPGVSVEETVHTLDALVAAVAHSSSATSVKTSALTALLLATTEPAAALACVEHSGVRAILQGAACGSSDGMLRTHASVVLSKLRERIGKSIEKRMEDDCANFLLSRLHKSVEEGAEAVRALCVVLQASIEMGETLLNADGVVETVLKLAEAPVDDVRVAVAEAMALAASDKKRCAVLLNVGFATLKALYKSEVPRCKVRAMAGLCRIGAVTAGDASKKTLQGDSMANLSKVARRFVRESKDDPDLKRWAVESVAFVSMDPEVKEALAGDTEALRALFSMAEDDDQSIRFGVTSTIANVVNAHERKKMDAEMEKLRKFAKEHVPEDHPLDLPEPTNARIDKMLAAGVVAAVSKLGKSDSAANAELCARILLALVQEQNRRGRVVQEGGMKTLCRLAGMATEAGRFVSAQAMAKIAITTNPKLFSGQRASDLVKPLIQLLGVNATDLQQFEGLMALTNLAGENDELRHGIVLHEGFHAIETLMFDEHPMIQRAAFECMCNMLMSEEVADYYADPSGRAHERLKLWFLFPGEEDDDLARAAGGGLAILVNHPKHAKHVCEQIVKHAEGVKILKEMCLRKDEGIQMRGVFVVAALIASGRELAEAFVNSEDSVELLTALSGAGKADVAQRAKGALAKLVEYGLIKETH
jgi:protein unc-45